MEASGEGKRGGRPSGRSFAHRFNVYVDEEAAAYLERASRQLGDIGTSAVVRRLIREAMEREAAELAARAAA